MEDAGFGYYIPYNKKPFTTLKKDLSHHLRPISVYLGHHASQVLKECAQAATLFCFLF